MTDIDDLMQRARAIERRSFNELWTLVVETASVLTEIDPPRRRAWLASVVERMVEEQDGFCGLCGLSLSNDAVEVDHIIPFCYGGGNERDNLQVTHMRCNREKRNSVDPVDLLRYLEDRYMNL